ncbi:hypothetical protein FOMPIDRAFT_1045070 [Fomitopsis schrenkii]|uniref:DNA mismatch repair protein Mlh1 C-terminal domain-containing protein n=1 Tax=Fomitopsis schrenkii TaxID=2126942 RepID=S8ES81_FOMSC|nr:hypothetical protein FOMPIDRAFT_1045070 [Fomitopsis schrenkii]
MARNTCETRTRRTLTRWSRNLCAAPPKKTLSLQDVRTSRTFALMFPVFSALLQRRVGARGSHSTNTNISPLAARGVREARGPPNYLTATKRMRAALVKGTCNSMPLLLQRHTFIGIPDASKCLCHRAFDQAGCRQPRCRFVHTARNPPYQLGLGDFGDMGRLRLDPAPSLRTLVALVRSKLTRPQIIVDPIVDMLLSRREMLADLSSLRICADGRDDTLAVLPDHTPLPARPRGHSYTERKDRELI